jgi:hypothetical protein
MTAVTARLETKQAVPRQKKRAVAVTVQVTVRQKG